MTPRDIDETSLWEFNALRRGYEMLHGKRKTSGRSMSEDRLAELGIEGF